MRTSSSAFAIADAGEFNIGCFYDDGSLTPDDGEFRVTLVGVGGELLPHVEAYGEGVGSLRRAIDVGLLDQLEPVRDHVEFSARLVAIGLADLSDLEVGEEATTDQAELRTGSNERQARGAESAALAFIVERVPEPTSEAQLMGFMTEIVSTPERIALVGRAIVGLVEADLLNRDRDLLNPTPAARRAAGLELGL